MEPLKSYNRGLIKTKIPLKTNPPFRLRYELKCVFFTPKQNEALIIKWCYVFI